MNIFRGEYISLGATSKSLPDNSLTPTGSLSRQLVLAVTNWLDRILNKMSTLGVIGGATGWSGYISIMPDDPDKLVALFPIPGGTRDQTSGLRADVREYVVRIRGASFGYEDATAKAREIMTTLNNVDVDGLVFNLTINSPQAAGYDRNDRPVIELPFRVVKQP